MRKLKFHCNKSRTAYAAASCAITEVGMTKGFKDKQTFTRSVAWQEGELRGTAAVYDAIYSAEGDEVIITIDVSGCFWNFTFTWPELKLTACGVRDCGCVT